MSIICGCEGLENVDILQRKVVIIAKALIILHIIVSTILFEYLKKYLIAWIPFLIPILCLYNGAQNRKRGLLIPFMLSMVLVQTTVIFFSFYYIVYCLKYAMVSAMISIGINTTYYIILFLVGSAVLGFANFVTLWIQATTHKFYSSIGTNSTNEPVYEYRTYIPNPITQRQNPTFRRTIDIVRSNTGSENQNMDVNDIVRSNTGNEDHNLDVNNVGRRFDSEQENLCLNNDSSESKQDVPPSYIDIITSSGDGFLHSPPSFTDAMKNEQITN